MGGVFLFFVSSFSILLNRLLLFCLFFALQHCLVLLPVLVSLAFTLTMYTSCLSQCTQFSCLLLNNSNNNNPLPGLSINEFTPYTSRLLESILLDF